MKTREKAQGPPKPGKKGIDFRLLDLYDSCLKNAKELIEEANILLASARHPRAYFLAFTAMEELGKSQVVADYFNQMVAHREFEAAFREHRFKAAYAQRYVAIPPDLQQEWFIEYDTRSVPSRMEQRNKSLYVEYLPDYTPVVPIQAISAESATQLVASAQKYLHEILHMAYISERIGTKAFTK